MCILFLYLSNSETRNGGPCSPHGKVFSNYKLILASNRDEFYDRPSEPVQLWDDGVTYGGKDVKPGREGGTWLAINSKTGKIGVLLNVMVHDSEFGKEKNSHRSRGFLVSDYLKAKSPLEHAHSLTKMASEFDPFKLIMLAPAGDNFLFRGCEVTNRPESQVVGTIESGIHGFGNNLPNTTWKKVTEGRKLFHKLLQEKGDAVAAVPSKLSELIVKEVLGSLKRTYPDEAVQKQGGQRPGDYYERASSVFVDVPFVRYGTRSQAVILVDYDNHVFFYERYLIPPSKSVGGENFSSLTATWGVKSFSFKLPLISKPGKLLPLTKTNSVSSEISDDPELRQKPCKLNSSADLNATTPGWEISGGSPSERATNVIHESVGKL